MSICLQHCLMQECTHHAVLTAENWSLHGSHHSRRSCCVCTALTCHPLAPEPRMHSSANDYSAYIHQQPTGRPWQGCTEQPGALISWRPPAGPLFSEVKSTVVSRARVWLSGWRRAGLFLVHFRLKWLSLISNGMLVRSVCDLFCGWSGR